MGGIENKVTVFKKQILNSEISIGAKPPSLSCICLCFLLVCLSGLSSLVIHFRSIAVLNIIISEITCSPIHRQASPPQCSTFFLVIFIIKN